MIVCVPGDNDEVLQLAVQSDPLPADKERLLHPGMGLPSLLKVTTPPLSPGSTDALNVTDWPEIEVAEDARTDVELVACCTVCVALPELPV